MDLCKDVPASNTGPKLHGMITEYHRVYAQRTRGTAPSVVFSCEAGTILGGLPAIASACWQQDDMNNARETIYAS